MKEKKIQACMCAKGLERLAEDGLAFKSFDFDFRWTNLTE
jgi:hypothetical protein